MRDFINTIRRLFRLPTKPTPHPAPVNEWPAEKVGALLEMASLTEPDDYSCADCDRLLARFTEAMAAGEAAAHLMPRVQKHLKMCPHCHEEFAALLQILEHENSVNG